MIVDFIRTWCSKCDKQRWHESIFGLKKCTLCDHNSPHEVIEISHDFAEAQ